MQSKSGVMIGPDGLRLEWRGIPLWLDDNAQLEVPSTHCVNNQSRVGLDGHVALLQSGRVQLSAGSRKGVGPFDGWIVDRATGHRIAWRGTGTPVVCDALVATVKFPGDYFVSFSSLGLTAWMELMEGEVILDSLPPKSRQRRLRRALRAGAKHAGHGLLMYVSPEPGQWPPRQRNRTKRGEQPALAQGQGHDVPAGLKVRND